MYRSYQNESIWNENKWRLIIPSTSKITYHIVFVIVCFWCSSIRPKCRNKFPTKRQTFQSEQINNNDNLYKCNWCVFMCVSLKFIIQSETCDLSMWYFEIAYSFFSLFISMLNNCEALYEGSIWALTCTIDFPPRHKLYLHLVYKANNLSAHAFIHIWFESSASCVSV